MLTPIASPASRWLALRGWRLIWPEWSPFLEPFVIIGVVVAVALGAWVTSARWMKQ